MSERVARMAFPGPADADDRAFEAVLSDLLAEPVDAIFNAANGMLAHGGGVAAAIARAAGPDLEREGDAIVKARGRVPVGGAVVTTAGRLPFKGVVHVVGPHLGEGDEEDKLVRALKAGFAAASERGWTSVSFPAVSSGIFAVPVPVCARAYVRAVSEFFADQPASSLKTVRLALFGGPIVDAVRAAME